MAYTVVAGDEFMVNLYTRWQDQEAVNRLRIWCTNVIGLFDSQNLADRLSVRWAPLMKSGLATDGSYSGCTVRRVEGAGPQPMTRFSTISSGSGTGATPTLPRQTCGLISLYTDLGGRKYRGRFYYPFVSSDYQEADGSPTADFLGTVLGDIVVEVLDFVTLVSGVTSCQIRYGLHPGAAWFEKYTAAKKHDRWATQQRRGDFGKQNRNPFA